MAYLKNTFNEIRSECDLSDSSRRVDVKTKLKKCFGKKIVFDKMTSSNIIYGKSLVKDKVLIFVVIRPTLSNTLLSVAKGTYQIVNKNNAHF